MVGIWSEESNEFRGSFDPHAEEVNDTCKRIRQSVNNSRPLEADADFIANELFLIGAILFSKLLLWVFYRAARSIDLDVSNL